MEAKRYEFKGSAKSITDILDESKMDWVADQHELVTTAGISVGSHKALIRSDNQGVLGIVGKKYEPVQNSMAFAFMDTICQAKGASYKYLYSLGGGSRMIAQAKLDNDFNVKRGDTIESHITVINSFNGSSPLRAFFTPVRMVCANQCRGAIRSATECVSIRHTKNAETRVEEAFRIFELSLDYFEKFKEISKQLVQKLVDKQMVNTFLEEVIGKIESQRKQNQHDEITDLFEHGKGNHGKTAWDLYNGAIEWVDHHRTLNKEKRLAASLIGAGIKTKERAWDSATTFLN